MCIWIGNYLGRRKTIFVGSIIMVIGASLQACAYSLPHLIVGRIITGVGNGMNTSTVPTWQSGEYFGPISDGTMPLTLRRMLQIPPPWKVSHVRGFLDCRWYYYQLLA